MKKNVLIFDSSYSLLIYSVLYPQCLSNTIYIHSDNMGIQGLNYKGKTHFVFKKGSGKFGKIMAYVFFYFRLLFDGRLRRIITHKDDYQFIGQDHLFFSRPFIHDFILLEDGLANYTPPNYSFLYRLILGKGIFGRSVEVKKIFLTGMSDYIDNTLKTKVVFFDFRKKWDELTPLQHQEIKDFFYCSDNDLLPSGDILLLTQPLSEYGFIDESEKIEIYRQLLSEFQGKTVIIRQHPREITDYSKYFPAVNVNKSKVPVELLMLSSPGIDKAVTLFSGSIFNLPCSEKIFKGTSYAPILLEKFGLIEGVTLRKDKRDNK